MPQTDRLLLFDAVGTLIVPEPDVITIYHQIGRRFGSQLGRQQISDRFKIGRTKYFSSKPDLQTACGGLESSDSIERELWRELVQFVLADVRPISPAFETLWEHFSKPTNWKVFPDVGPCWNQIRKMGASIGIASNFDSRLRVIAESLEPLAQTDILFCSAEVGFRKPDPAFYRTIAQRLGVDNRTNIWMVGDNYEHDVVGPQRAGWNSVWLNRAGPTTRPTPTAAESIRSLSELSTLILESG